MHYSGQEIIQIAVRIEENGNAFYLAAAERVKEATDTRNLFLDLAEKEVSHIATFQKLAERFEADDFDFGSEDASGYIQNLADKHLFGKPEAGIRMAQTVKTPHEALEIALKFENDSVDFYTELGKRARSDARKLISQIIDEEKEHAAGIREFL